MRQKGLTEMKNDSNMFNDNSIETEGAPADKTAESRSRGFDGGGEC